MSIHKHFFLGTSSPAVGAEIAIVDLDGAKHTGKVTHVNSRKPSHFIVELDGDADKQVWVDQVSKVPSAADHDSALAADQAALEQRNAKRKKGQPQSEADVLRTKLAAQEERLAKLEAALAEKK